MDILNFISWIRGGRVVTTVNPAQTLLPVGLKDNRRDDGYLAGAISVEDLVTQLTPTPTYKVFTALLTQSGGDDVQFMNDDIFLVKGVTYDIVANDVPNFNFVPYGAPNNNNGTKFIANQTISFIGIVDCALSYNTGAPVATILENTIGNIWFSYNGVGDYYAYSNTLFTQNKTVVLLGTLTVNSYDHTFVTNNGLSDSSCAITVQDSGWTLRDDELNNTPIEIRVYN